MADLIDRKALIAKCGEWYVEEGPEIGFIGTLKALLDMAPAVDAAPVKQGRWIDMGDATAVCSECNNQIFGEPEYDFCPHCGAKMEVGE